MNPNDYSAYCAEGVKSYARMIPVSSKVRLKVVCFESESNSTKPVIVFVAGWVTQMEAWENVLHELTGHFNVLYIETREKNSSCVDGKTKYSVQDIGRDIAQVTRLLIPENKNYMLMGSSLGATAILDCEPNLKNKPGALVLIGPNAEFRVPKIWVIMVYLFYPGFYNAIKPLVKWYLRTFRLDLKTDYKQYLKYSKALDAADPWKLKKAVLALRKYKVWGKLSSIKLPVLLIGASSDKLHEPEHFTRIGKLLIHSKSLDFETNRRTHSREMVFHLKQFAETIGSV